MTRRSALCLGLVVLFTSAVLPGCGDRERRSAQVSSPEEMFTYAVSRIRVSWRAEDPQAALLEALSIMKELEAGAPFAEVARQRSDDETTAKLGGWVGFVGREPTTFGGAFQALVPGATSRPIVTDEGYVIVHRHTYEEGRILERQYSIPAYGFFIPWGQGAGGGATLPATRKLAQEAWQKVSSGEITLAAAAEEYGAVPPPRTDCYIAHLSDDGRRTDIYDALKDLEPGEVAPLQEVGTAFAVLKRGDYFRSVVRQILVMHVGSDSNSLVVTRSRQDAAARAEEALAEVLADPSKWADAVLRYSDDASQHALQGGIGTVTNGGTEPSIETALLETRPGDIVDHVVESKDGFHVIWRVN